MGQGSIFLIMTAMGFAMGLFYDIFRILRRSKEKSPKTAGVAVQDILFWSISTAALFFLLLNTNFGQIRGYVFLGVAIGLVLYFQTLSRIFLPFGTKAASSTRRQVCKKTKKAKEGLQKGARYVKMKTHNAQKAIKCKIQERDNKQKMQKEKNITKIDAVFAKRRAFALVKAFLFLAAIVAIVVVSLQFISNHSRRMDVVNTQIEETNRLVQNEIYRQQEIAYRASYTQSIDFIESIARNFLGLVHRDELILIMVE